MTDLETELKNNLELRLNETFIGLNIDEIDQNIVKANLAKLKGFHLPTYEHCIRTGFLMDQITEHFSKSKDIGFFSGLMHDIGKLYIGRRILDTSKGFGKREMKKMRNHVILGYNIVRAVDLYSAEIILRNHKYQKDPYPRQLPVIDPGFLRANRVSIEEYSKLLALTDSYDACQRKNDRNGSKESKEVLVENFNEHPDIINILNGLYEAEIFK